MLREFSGVGPRVFSLLERLGLTTIEDLFFHLPLRYQNRTRITPIGELREGDYVLIEGEVSGSTMSSGRRPNFLCQLSDSTGNIYLRFFHFNAQQKNQLSMLGTRLRCFGEVKRAYRQFGLEIIHPEYRHMKNADELPLDQHLTPIYPTTQGVSQPLLRKLTDQALKTLTQSSQSLEFIPADVLKKYQLSDLKTALLYVHRPPPDADVDQLLSGEHPAQKRLAFEELVAHQVSLQKFRWQLRRQNALSLKGVEDRRQEFLSQLSFSLTAAQQRVIDEIDNDLVQPHPMLRLLQGDVGSGKTVVAAMVMLKALAQNTQAALMAPTELLIEQHYQTFSRWFEPLGICVAYLSGKQSAKNRRDHLEKIAQGEASIILGTHAIFQEGVEFSHLSLLVIDEQHRFGVNQRLALRSKGLIDGLCPHQLVMSATPIPRTLAMTAYADLDVSTIDELPPGRKPIVTALVSNKRREEVIERVRAACQKGRQVYWVCTLIEESEALSCQAAEDTAVTLQNIFPELSVGLVHSRLTSDEKSLQMQQFKNGEMNLLVATTVIEVGVDVPNASLMIIENPERLGLAQLHQLRGRIGRGSIDSFCILLFQAPLSEVARRRLQVMRDTQDGFVIAQEDLNIRGPGEVLGTRQSGLLRLKIADLVKDQHLLPAVQEVAQTLVKEFPDQVPALISRWLRNAEAYGQV